VSESEKKRRFKVPKVSLRLPRLRLPRMRLPRLRLPRPHVTALPIAWALLVCLVGGTAVWPQLTHVPPPEETPSADAGAPPGAEPGDESTAEATNGHGTPAEGEAATAEAAPGRADVPLQIARGPGSLVVAPVPELTEETERGPLPRIALDGRQPWQVYSRPFDQSDRRPRVAVVISGLGRSAAATAAAVQDLPGEVTLAFLPYGAELQHWIDQARAAGHEVLLNLPMEPLDYPDNDPGPNALFTALSADENVDRLEWALSRVAGYVGVTNHMGSRFAASPDAMTPVIKALKSRGLLFLDSRASARSVGVQLASTEGVPRAINDRFLDNREASRAVIDARLAEVERIARATGASIAIGQPYPVTMERVAAWIRTLEAKGIAVAPVSALTNRQTDR